MFFKFTQFDAAGDVVVRKTLRRAQLLPFFAKMGPCLIGIEACGTSRHWARELTALGHEVRLMPPAYVKPYVKRGKNDAVDAEAICEAVKRPTMRYVAVKSREQQAALTLHRSRTLLVGQRTQLINMIRSLLAEFGIVIPEGRDRALIMARQIVDSERTPEVPDDAAMIVAMLSQQALDIRARLHAIELRLAALQRSDEVAQRLSTIPGIGPVGATALAASVSDPHQFRACSEAREGRDGRHGEQDGPDRMGAHDAGTGLSGPSCPDVGRIIEGAWLRRSALRCCKRDAM